MDPSDFSINIQETASYSSDEDDVYPSRPIRSKVAVAIPSVAPPVGDLLHLTKDLIPEISLVSEDVEAPFPPKVPVQVRHYVVKPGQIEEMKEQALYSPNLPPPRESMLQRIWSPQTSPNQQQPDVVDRRGYALKGIGSDDFYNRAKLQPKYRNLVGNSVAFGHSSYSPVREESTTVQDDGMGTADDNLSTAFSALHDDDSDQEQVAPEMSITNRLLQQYQKFTGSILENRHSRDKQENSLRESLHVDFGAPPCISEPQSPNSLHYELQYATKDLALDVDEITNSTLFTRLDTGHVRAHFPKDDVRLVMDRNLEPGILCRRLCSEEEYLAFQDFARNYDIEDDQNNDEANENEPFLPRKTRRFKQRYTKLQQVPPLTYVLTVDDDIYKRMIHEVADRWRTPCGLYFCCRENEESKPSPLVAFALLSFILLALFVPTLIWPTD